MRHLLQVLIRSLARLFQGCADVLAALGRAAGPAAGELPASAFISRAASGPPEDWVERTNPPPPAHWLEVVKQRAPGFLKRDSRTGDPRAKAVRPLPERSPEPEPSLRPSEPPRASWSMVRSTEEAGREQERFSARPPAPEPARISNTPRAKAPRSVRIVTVVEESPSRKPAPVRANETVPADPEARESALNERPLRNPAPGRDPQDLVSPRLEADPPPRTRSEPDRSSQGRGDDAEREEAWQPLLRPALATPAVPAVPGSAVIPALESSEGILRLPPPEVRAWAPEFRRKEGAPAAPFSGESLSRWPELPASAESDDLEDARILCRELRRQAVLEEEQRGIPWSA